MAKKLSEYDELVRVVRELRNWRDSCASKRKARAIQKVIEKKVPMSIPKDRYHVCGDFFDSYNEMSREEFMNNYMLYDKYCR